MKENEILECDCPEGEEEHVIKPGLNGETIVECVECKRFIKFPAEDKTEYKGKIIKDYTKKDGIGPNK